MSLVPIAAELWKGPTISSGVYVGDDAYAVIVTRADVGTYTVWIGMIDMDAEIFTGLNKTYKKKPMDVKAVEAWLLAQETQDDPNDYFRSRKGLEAMGLHAHRPEFAMEKAALKTARRLLGKKSRAAETADGWEPIPGWDLAYKGRLSFTSYDANAKWRKVEADIEDLKQRIADMEPKSDFAESDEDYRARRLAKIQLKRKLKEMENRKEAR